MAEEPNLVEMTIEVVSNYVAHNNIRPEDVPDFIAKTHTAIEALVKRVDAPAEPAAEAPPEHVPAVTARKSLASRDHIISMIDGRPYKTLKRHLSGHGLTPAQYRERYNLKPDYPMVAPAYSEHRREVAKTLGLGRKPRASVEAADSPPAAGAKIPNSSGARKRSAQNPPASAEPTSARRGRRKAAAAAGEPAPTDAS